METLERAVAEVELHAAIRIMREAFSPADVAAVEEVERRRAVQGASRFRPTLAERARVNLARPIDAREAVEDGDTHVRVAGSLGGEAMWWPRGLRWTLMVVAGHVARRNLVRLYAKHSAVARAQGVNTEVSRPACRCFVCLATRHAQ